MMFFFLSLKLLFGATVVITRPGRQKPSYATAYAVFLQCPCAV